MSSAQGGGNDAAQVRVVIITTQYFETDPANFKSVVQRLTGKHSHHHHIQSRHRQPPPPRPRLLPASTAGVTGGSSSRSGNNINASSSLPSSSSLTFSRGLSLSDLDKLHTLPSWEEISQLCM